MKQQKYSGHDLKTEKRVWFFGVFFCLFVYLFVFGLGFFFNLVFFRFFCRSVHVPSYGRKQNLRLCPPLSLCLSLKPTSQIIFLPSVSLVQEILSFCAGGV